jgi:putative ABC transport system permease protein
VQYQLSYDKFNVNANEIYRLTEVLHLPTENNARAVTSPPMAPALKANFPEVKDAVRISYSGRYISYNNKKMRDARIMYADSGFFNVFSFPVIEGNLQKALSNPYSIVLTQSMAKKYFPQNFSAMGKTMRFSDTIPLTVTAVIKDVPANAHFKFDCILSRNTINAMSNNEPETEWFNNNYYTYLLLQKNADYHQLEKKFNAYIARQMKDATKETGLYYDLKLQPLTSIHLHSDLHAEIQPNSNIVYVYIFCAAALLILLIACINFINLSTAKSISRAKEIGLRKVIGASRRQLIFQFLGESFLFTVTAAALSIACIILLMPWFVSFTDEQLTFHFVNADVLLLFAGVIIIVSITAGIYPAFLLSSFSPVKVLKGTTKYEWRDIFLRKGLVVFQFTIAIVLISGALLVYQQLRFIQNQKLGLNKNQVMEINIPSSQLSKQNILLQQSLKVPGVLNASLTGFSFKEGVGTVATLPEGFSNQELFSIGSVYADENFLKTFQIPLAAGRDFSRSFPTDADEAFIVNETAVKVFNWKNNNAALGKTIDWGLGKKGKVIGVVKDFNYSSLHDNIKPLIIQILPEGYGFIALRINPDNMQQTIASLAATWKKTVNEDDFSYSFLDEDFAALYQSEQNLQRVLALFTALSVIIACLGLFGLAAFTIAQRVKEIGIRKVVGATITSILALLSKDFLKLVFIAVCIASPVAWFIVNKWLQNFAYHIQISWFTFILVGLCAMLLALITVSFQAIKAAIANPVKSLRTE